MLLGTGTPSPLPLSDSTVLAPAIARGNYNSLPGSSLVFAQPKTKRIKEFMDVHISFPHQLDSSAETSSDYIFGAGIDVAHGIL